MLIITAKITQHLNVKANVDIVEKMYCTVLYCLH